MDKKTMRLKRQWLWMVPALAAMVLAHRAEVRRLTLFATLSAQGPGTSAIVPFKIHVPDTVLKDLKDRLAGTRYPDQIEGAGWDYGTNLEYLKELIEYWRTKFDWREQERRLNRFEQFKTKIDGLDVHFIHRRAQRQSALPLLIVHGWPGSFMQFHKVIEPLTDPARYGGNAEDAFDVVVPSLPGYGFSDIPRHRGYDPQKIASLFVVLMARLGYTRYGVQASDFGAPVIRAMAIMDAAHIVGYHTESCRGGPPPGMADPNAGIPEFELARMRDRQGFFSGEEQAYNQIQGTKPQTLGYGLNDSPAGLAAWIVEKFRAWSDVDGNVEKKFTKDELLTNITIYWVTQTANSAGRLYYEARHPVRSDGVQTGGRGDRGVTLPRVEVPSACVSWPKDVGFAPRKWMEAYYNVKRFTFMPRGGHFGAFEEPQLYLDDVREFFRNYR
jgi:pimeloyl-ACP methyl ester carboxylesterase